MYIATRQNHKSTLVRKIQHAINQQFLSDDKNVRDFLLLHYPTVAFAMQGIDVTVPN